MVYSSNSLFFIFFQMNILFLAFKCEQHELKALDDSYSHIRKQDSPVHRNSAPSVKRTSQLYTYLALLYSLCCPFPQLAQEFLVFRPCPVYLLAHRVLAKTPTLCWMVHTGQNIPGTPPVSAMKVLQTELRTNWDSWSSSLLHPQKRTSNIWNHSSLKLCCHFDWLSSRICCALVLIKVISLLYPR